MKCPDCGALTQVIEKRNPGDRIVRRRHRCTHCKRRFTTYEKIHAPSLTKKKNTSNSVPLS